MMTWAREAKLDTADVDLVDITDIHGLPSEVGAWTEKRALIVRRFDRDQKRRIHIEDFAQILNTYSESKYKFANYETVGKIIPLTQRCWLFYSSSAYLISSAKK
ncbi:HipA domain-containing protein [Salmonella enterica]|uniref:HipA domain-containing protein n=1 Tax=Salmonella enterica subsp. enterica serovar Dessau TaxID=2564349 RepID=A0A8E5IML7_SALET|nr:HipA domain-containing protein [Salmonella enterica]QUS47089.1 HipA domain-containing protein [Salmonella enterica subsp. enterica serovar Dessau]